LETINAKKAERDTLRERQLELAARLQNPGTEELETKLNDAKKDGDQAVERYNTVVLETGQTLDVGRCEELRTFYKKHFSTRLRANLRSSSSIGS